MSTLSVQSELQKKSRNFSVRWEKCKGCQNTDKAQYITDSATVHFSGVTHYKNGITNLVYVSLSRVNQHI